MLFKEKFPNLYALRSCEEARLKTRRIWQNNSWVWNFEWKRQFE